MSNEGLTLARAPHSHSATVEIDHRADADREAQDNSHWDTTPSGYFVDMLGDEAPEF